MFTTPSSSGVKRRRQTDAGSSRNSGSQNGDASTSAAATGDTSAKNASAAGLGPPPAKKRVGAVNLATRQPSFAYGAAVDESLLGGQRLGARLSNSTSRSPGPGDDSTEKEENPESQAAAAAAAAVPSATAAFERNAQPARARYAQLKAQRGAAAALAAQAEAKRASTSTPVKKRGNKVTESSNADQKPSSQQRDLNLLVASDALGTIESPQGTRRSARMSEAGSLAGGDDSHHRESFLSENTNTTHVSETQRPGARADPIEEEVEEEEEEEEIRHSQQKAQPGPSQQQSRVAIDETGRELLSPPGRARANGQVNAVYLRAGDQDQRARAALSPTLDNHAFSPETSYRPSILAGAQKASHDLYHSFERARASVGMSSTGGEDSASYDYAAEDAMTRDMMDDSRAGGESSSRSWLGGFRSPSSFLGGASNGKSRSLLPPNGPPNGSAHDNSSRLSANGPQGDISGDTQTGRTKQRRKVSRDNQSYHPDANEEGDSDDFSEDGRKHTHRRKGRAASGGGKNARDIGNKDRETWMKGGKRRRGRGRRNGGADGGEEDANESSELSDPDDEGEDPQENDHEEADVTVGASTTEVSQSSSARPSRKGQRRSKRSAQGTETRTGALSSLAKYADGAFSTLKSRGALAFLSVALLAAAVSREPTRQALSELANATTSGSSARSYKALEMMPTDVQEVIKRLRKLEVSVASLSGLDSDVQGVKSELSRVKEDVFDRLSAIERSSATTRKTVEMLEARAQELQRELSKSLDNARAKERSLQEELVQLRSSLHQVEAGVSAGQTSSGGSVSANEASELRKKAAQVQSSLEEMKRKVAGIEAARESGEKRQGEFQQKLDAIVQSLPAQMPVRRDLKTNQVHIEGDFWTELKKVFASHGTVEQIQQDLTSKKAWQSFRQANEEALRAVVKQEWERQTTSGGSGSTLIGRDDFRSLLESELSVIKAEMEKKFNANLDGVKDELWEKVRLAGETYQASDSLPKSSSDMLHKLSNDAASIPLTLQDGSDARSAVLVMIDAALEKYSADRVGRQDYALYSAGGRIIPSLTSPTYQLGSASWLSKVIPGYGSDQVLRGRAPVTAIYHDNAPGMCWTFAGSNGQLGVALAQSVVVSDLTFEHTPSSLVGSGISSAPRDIAVWGYMHRPEDKIKFARYTAQLASSDMIDPLPTPPSDDYLYLGSFTYDASIGAKPVQTYPVPPEIRALNIPTSILRFRFTSNHGNPNYTCLYRVRAHGEPAEA